MKRSAWNKGTKMTNVTKKRISISRKGKPAWNKGASWSDEVKTKISKARKGQSSWNKGRPWPKKIKRKISRTKLIPEVKFTDYYRSLELRFGSNFSKIDEWLVENLSNEIIVECERGKETLPTHIRHCIHHADHPGGYSQKELLNATRILSKLNLQG